MAKIPAATEEDRLKVARIALGAIGAGDLALATRPLGTMEDRRFPFPADVLIELGADALAMTGATRATPVSFVEVRERYLPEFEFHGKTAHQKSHAAINLVVAVHAGISPDYDGVAGWWRVQDLSWFAFCALVIMARIAAERTGTSIREVSDAIALGRGITL